MRASSSGSLASVTAEEEEAEEGIEVRNVVGDLGSMLGVVADEEDDSAEFFTADDESSVVVEADIDGTGVNATVGGS